jgi:endonuclease/exonuclease/phosphatase family metal-dependent hydrolase
VQKLIDILRTLQAQYGGQVIMAGDLNSTANTRPYNNVQHALLGAGLYDSYATSQITNGRYSTSNNFNFPVRPTPGRRDYIMTLGPIQGSCAYRNQAYTSVSRVASDHFLQAATLPLAPQ